MMKINQNMDSSMLFYRNKLPIWKTKADTTHAKRVV